MATLDVLGEDIHLREEAVAGTEMIIRVLDTIHDERLDSNVSIKLSQLGLKLDRNFCLENACRIVAHARTVKNFIRIDMEDSSCTSDTLWVYRQLRKEFDNLGIELLAKRSEEHTSELQSLTNLVCRLLLEKKKNKI